MTSYYQPAVGEWTLTPLRRVLWAANQVLIYLTKTVPEDPHVHDWTLKLEQELTKPVYRQNWKAYFKTVEQHYRDEDARFVKNDRDDPPLPDRFNEAWAALPDVIKKRLYEQAATIRTSALGLPFDPQDFEKGVEATMHLIRGIPDSQKAALRRVLRIAYEKGKGPAGFARLVKQEWAAYAGTKAEQIAVTEWNRAASVATRESYLRQGVDRVRWYTAGDDRVCPICEANAAEMDIPITEQFFSGDFTPPAHPGCRCDVSAA